jgi:hypothetical protein
MRDFLFGVFGRSEKKSRPTALTGFRDAATDIAPLGVGQM